jgi:hypothetical protein
MFLAGNRETNIPQVNCEKSKDLLEDWLNERYFG